MVLYIFSISSLSFLFCLLLIIMLKLENNLGLSHYRNIALLKAYDVSLSKTLYPHYLILVGSTDGFEKISPINVK